MPADIRQTGTYVEAVNGILRREGAGERLADIVSIVFTSVVKAKAKRIIERILNWKVAVMKCPYCDKEMQQGYVQCRDGLHWTPKKQKVAALSGMGKGAVAIGNEAGYMANSCAIAFHCEDCKMVIIQYGKSKEGNQ